MEFLLESIGTAIPDVSAEQPTIMTEMIRFADGDDRTARQIRALYRRTGITRRGSVLFRAGAQESTLPFYEGQADEPLGPGTAKRMEAYERHALTLARAAAQSAISSAGVPPRDITRMVVVSCTGFSAPGIDLALIAELGLSPRVKRAQIGFMGCHGALNGLEVARSMAATAASGERTLLIAVELCSLHAQSGSRGDDIVANALFADGAAAVVGRFGSVSSEAWALVDTRSFFLPGTADLMTWRITDHGFRMSLSPRIPGLLDASLATVVGEWLAESSITPDDIATWAVHPGGVRILDAVESSLGLDVSALEASREVLRKHGNMSSPTILFVLDLLRRRDCRLPIVLLAFGPGLTIEMARIGGPAPPR